MTRAEARGLSIPDPEVEAQVRARLDDVEASLEKAVRADYEILGEAAFHLLSAGGKRLRPMLVLLSGYFGDRTDPRLVPGAVAIELTHVATLYHDDVMDEADSRHGVPSVNAQWGNSVAILSGDYLFARASEISADLGAEVTRLLARTIATVCDGQIREVTVTGNLEQSEKNYMETIRRKTAALIATSCRLGGMLSEASAELVDLLDRFGEALGMGFQVSDDIMDLISTEQELGKEPGVDLRQGVYTLPMLYAMHGADGPELAELLSDGPPAAERFGRALELVRREEPLKSARRVVTGEVRRAMELASGLPQGPAREALEHIARFIAVRCGASV